MSWWSLNAKPSGAEVAAFVTERPAFNQDLFQESVRNYTLRFALPTTPDQTVTHAKSTPSFSPADEEYEQTRNVAYTVVSEVVELLRKHLW